MRCIASSPVVAYGAAVAARRAASISLREKTTTFARVENASSRQWTVHDEDGEPLDATFRVEPYETRLSIVVESGGGARGSAAARNSDYRAGLELLLARVAPLGLLISEALVDSSTVSHLAAQDRRLDLAYPLMVTDPVEQRKQIGAATARVGRRPGARGGGNPEKRIRIVLAGPVLTADELGSVLAHGEKE